MLVVSSAAAVGISIGGFDFNNAATTAVNTASTETKAPVTETVTILGQEYDIAATTALDLSGQGIDDDTLNQIVPEIQKLTNLTVLNLFHNEITDITPLAQLTNLTELYLDKNRITDAAPLAQLTNLTDLILSDNQITPETIETLKSQLPNCHIEY